MLLVPCAVTAGECGALHCELGCRPTHAGLACYCGVGYEADAAGRCVDTDECQWEDTCAQHCHNSRGSYTCACAPGYTLHDDARDCVPVNGEYENKSVFFFNPERRERL